MAKGNRGGRRGNTQSGGYPSLRKIHDGPKAYGDTRGQIPYNFEDEVQQIVNGYGITKEWDYETQSFIDGTDHARTIALNTHLLDEERFVKSYGKDASSSDFDKGYDITVDQAKAIYRNTANKEVRAIMDETGVDQITAEKYREAFRHYVFDYSGSATRKDYTSGKENGTVSTLNEALSKMGTYDGSISRGLMFNSEKQLDAFLKKAAPGKTFNSQKTVTSWTADEKFTSGYNVVLKMNKTKSGVSIEHLTGQYARSQHEVLLPSTAKFKVKNTYRTGPDNTWVIEVDEV